MLFWWTWDQILPMSSVFMPVLGASVSSIIRQTGLSWWTVVLPEIGSVDIEWGIGVWFENTEEVEWLCGKWSGRHVSGEPNFLWRESLMDKYRQHPSYVQHSFSTRKIVENNECWTSNHRAQHEANSATTNIVPFISIYWKASAIALYICRECQIQY